MAQNKKTAQGLPPPFKFYAVEFRDGGVLHRYVVKAFDAEHAAALARQAKGRGIVIEHTPRLIGREQALTLTRLYEHAELGRPL